MSVAPSGWQGEWPPVYKPHEPTPIERDPLYGTEALFGDWVETSSMHLTYSIVCCKCGGQVWNDGRPGDPACDCGPAVYGWDPE